MTGTLTERMLPAPVGGGFSMEGYWVWCGSVIRAEDGRYHLFASRWPRHLPMHPGWMMASEVVRAVSDTPAGPYRFEEIVLPARGAQYWDGRATHNPHITRCRGRYYLYYTGITHPFSDPVPGQPLTTDDCRVIAARASKRVGVAVADRITGPWRRSDQPVLTTRPDRFDSFLISNPAPCIEQDGTVCMMYKARGYLPPPYTGFLHGKMEFGMAQADRPEGPFRPLCDSPLFGPDVEFEDPFLWRDEEGYHMIAKDMRGNVCGERYGGLYATSPDRMHWRFHPGKLMYSRRVLWDDGVVREMGNLERPFLLFENGRPAYAFFATSDGTDGQGFHNCTRTWNMVIPLR